MTIPPFEGAVAIDTNIFEHLLNPRQNVDGHINSLLVHLQENDIALLVDDRERIAGEYNHHIGPIIQRVDDLSNEIYILRFWLLAASRISTAVYLTDPLMMTIREVIMEPSEVVDRIFVYVALSHGKLLVSNDTMHIVFGPSGGGGRSTRRQRLLRNSRRLRPPGAGIVTSEEANDMILANPTSVF